MPNRLVILIATSTPSVVIAQSTPANDLGASLVSMLFGLAIVVAMLFASLWLLRRLAQPRGAVAGQLRILAATAVGSRERVVVIEVGKSCLVLGVAPGQVTALAELPRADLPALPSSDTPGFAARLKQVLDRNAR
jgi:flagellar protein FliO/FliZ